MRYCNYSVEFPVFERCLNFAEEGKSRCAEHPTKPKKRRSGNLTYDQKERVREQFNHTCAFPGCNNKAHEVDHIVELNEFSEEEKWKANLAGNLQLLCFYHHSLKTAEYRKGLIQVDDVNDTSTSARNRKKKRRRAQGFYVT